MPHDGFFTEAIEPNRFSLESGVRFIGQCKTEQLIDEAASARLARRDALQLLAPHHRVRLREPVFGQRTNARQRRPQLVRHIASEFPLRPDARAKPLEQ